MENILEDVALNITSNFEMEFNIIAHHTSNKHFICVIFCW